MAYELASDTHYGLGVVTFCLKNSHSGSSKLGHVAHVGSSSMHGILSWFDGVKKLLLLLCLRERRKEMSRGSENLTKRKGVGGMGEKRNEACATWFTRTKTTLCTYACASLRHSPGII